MRNQIKQLSLGEGNTPLIRLYNLEKILSWKGQLWAKCEYQNPTGSFKDRGSIAEISKALNQGKKGIVCASTGNMAASLAAYAARANLSCLVFIPESTPPSKMRQAIICGTKVIKIKGTYDDCVQKARTFSQKNNLLLCGDYEIRRLGQSSIGVELAKSDIKFDSFIVPVGNGTVGCAIAEGFAKENKFPKFIGARAIGNNCSVASAMKVKKPLDGNLTLNWIKRSKGQMISVTDNEILKAQKGLAENEGLYVESSSATTVAAISKTRPTGNTVLILTGSGLKEGGE